MNPHPIDYHRILAQIALDHPNGGADLGAEVARRFMAEGDAPPPVINPPEDEPDYSGGTTPSEKMGMQQTGYMNPNVSRMPDPNEGNPISQPLPPVGDVNSPPDDADKIPVNPVTPHAPEKKTAPRGTSGGGGDHQSADDRKYDEATGEKIGSLEDQQDVLSQQAEKSAPEQDAIAKQEQARVDRSAQFAQQVQENEMRLARQHEDLVNQYANASVDPKRYWNNLDTGHQILAGISMFLGGGGDASPIVRNMNQDIQNQKDQIERTGKAAGMVGDLMSRYREMGLSDAQATQMAVTTASEVGKQRALATAEQFAPGMGRAKLGAAIADVTQGGITGKQGIHLTAADIAAKQSTAAEGFARAKQTNLQTTGIQQQMDRAKTLGLPPGYDPAKVVEDEAGNMGYARNEKALPEYQKIMMPIRGGLGEIQNINRARETNNPALIQAALGTHGAALGLYLAQMAGEHESQRNKEIIDALKGNPKDLTSIWWDQHRDAIQDFLQQAARNSEKNYQVDFNRPASVPEKKRY